MSDFRFVTIGWSRDLVERIWGDAARSGIARFSHVAHPRETSTDRSASGDDLEISVLRRADVTSLPRTDARLLASLEHDGVPTVHNMILGDRVVSKLAYDDAGRYATFVATRLLELFDVLRPSAVIGGFDALHSGLGLAVSRHLGIPWFAMHFSVLPQGLTCFCDRMSPAARIQLVPKTPVETRELAEAVLDKFERRAVSAPAYIAPPRSLSRGFAALPRSVNSLVQTMRRRRNSEFLKFTDPRTRYDALAAVRRLREMGSARRSVTAMKLLVDPPREPFVLFGLHMQPESSIDVWAPFFSNQLWVIELLSRSLPPTHRLLVKIHKSDVSNHAREALEAMRSFPGVELVDPWANSREFLEAADLVIAIQGTMGLEAALLGKSVIMLGESPVTLFPSASGIGRISDLPALVRRKLSEAAPERAKIIDAFAEYLSPFQAAGSNDWRAPPAAGEPARYTALFTSLRDYVVRSR